MADNRRVICPILRNVRLFFFRALNGLYNVFPIHIVYTLRQTLECINTSRKSIDVTAGPFRLPSLPPGFYMQCASG
jgi:hypothetical protein